MEKLTDWLNEKFKFNFKLGWKKSMQTGADWDGDMIFIGRNEYFIYHTVVHDVGIVDWFKLLRYCIGGKCPVHRLPMMY